MPDAEDETPEDREREEFLARRSDSLLVQEVLALSPAERLETLRVVAAFFDDARRMDE